MGCGWSLDIDGKDPGPTSDFRPSLDPFEEEGLRLNQQAWRPARQMRFTGGLMMSTGFRLTPMKTDFWCRMKVALDTGCQQFQKRF